MNPNITIHDILNMVDEWRENGSDSNTGHDRYVVSCPHPGHDDRNPSCTMYHDPATGHVNFNCHMGCSNQEIKEHLGIWRDGPSPNTSPSPPVTQRPTPRPRPKRPKKRKTHEEHLATHVYTLRNGSPIMRIERIRQYFDDGSSKKYMPSYHMDEQGQWQTGLGDVERPLYRMEDLIARRGDDNELWWHEGEQKADLCGQTFDVASTSINGGANAEPSETVLADLRWLGFRIINFVIDNDEPGLELANRLRDLLHEEGYVFRCWKAAVDTPKADIVDHIEAGFGIEDLVAVEFERPHDIGFKNELSRFLVNQAHGQLMFIVTEASEHQWYVYRDGIFRDGDHHAELFVKRLHERRNEEVRLETGNRAILRRLQSACEPNGVSGTLKSSKGELACDLDQLGQHIHNTLLPVVNGVIDLTTGNILPHSPKYRFTKICPTDFDPAADCPKWDAFLEQVIPDGEIRLWFQELAGSAITGIVPQLAVCALGKGANGKSTAFRVLSRVIGDSSVTGFCKYTNINSWIATGRERSGAEHSADFDAMRGKRLILASEPNPGAKLNINAVNGWTGGDAKTARGCSVKKETEFAPQGTLIFQTNHPPRIVDTSDGIWRRFLLWKWEVQIPEQDRIQDFDKLLYQEEGSGILNWMIDGAIRFLKRGIMPPTPKAIMDESRKYRNTEDELGQFLLEHVEAEEDATVSVTDMFERYDHWATQNSEAPYKKIGLGKELRRRGYSQKRITGGMHVWENIKLINHNDAPSDTERSW